MIFVWLVERVGADGNLMAEYLTDAIKPTFTKDALKAQMFPKGTHDDAVEAADFVRETTGLQVQIVEHGFESLPPDHTESRS